MSPTTTIVLVLRFGDMLSWDELMPALRTMTGFEMSLDYSETSAFHVVVRCSFLLFACPVPGIRQPGQITTTFCYRQRMDLYQPFLFNRAFFSLPCACHFLLPPLTCRRRFDMLQMDFVRRSIRRIHDLPFF